MLAPGTTRAAGGAAATVLALLVAGCPGPGWAPQQGPPRLEAGETARDAGTIRQGDALRAAFEVRNSGGRPLRFEPPRTGCGCSAELPVRELAPGAATVIGLRCPTGPDAGRVARSVTLYTNDPARPALTLRAVADVEPVAVAEPASLYLGPVRRGQTIGGALKVLTPAGSGVTFGPVEAPAAILAARLAALTPADTPAGMAGHLVEIGIAPEAPPGPFAAELRVPTGHAAVPVLTVPVGGIVAGAATASPPRLDFGRVSAAAGAVRVFEVRATEGQAVQLGTARMMPDLGVVEVEALQPGQRYRVTARLGGGAARQPGPGRVRGRVVLTVEPRTGDAEALEVPFSARVTAP